MASPYAVDEPASLRSLLVTNRLDDKIIEYML